MYSKIQQVRREIKDFTTRPDKNAEIEWEFVTEHFPLLLQIHSILT
jgi:hypothetical protein